MDCEPFQVVPHTADVAVIVHGHDYAELLRNAAAALYSLAAASPTTGEGDSLTFALKATDSTALLVDWLNELIYYLYTERLAFRRFTFTRLHGGFLQAVCYGSRFDVDAFGSVREVKAATYHMAHIKEQGGGLAAHIVLDI